MGSHFVHDPDTCKNTTLHAAMEGWTGIDLTVPDPEASFRRMGVLDFTGTACVGSPAGLSGDYTLASGSPCLPENSPCDSLIGALGQGCGALGIPDDKPPVTRAMLSAWPSPAFGAVQIAFAVPGDGAARVEIFDVAGRLVRRFEAALARARFPGTAAPPPARAPPAGSTSSGWPERRTGFHDDSC